MGKTYLYFQKKKCFVNCFECSTEFELRFLENHIISLKHRLKCRKQDPTNCEFGNFNCTSGLANWNRAHSMSLKVNEDFALIYNTEKY
jgi:hypothetical protein